MDVSVLNRQRKHTVDTAALKRAAERILTALTVGDCELSVTLVSDKRMRELNREFRGVDTPTDVLSFAQREGEAMPHIEGEPEPLGDVILSTETAARQLGLHAEEGATPEDSLQRELTFLLLHGILHLLGRTHDGEADREAMEAETARLWALIGM